VARCHEGESVGREHSACKPRPSFGDASRGSVTRNPGVTDWGRLWLLSCRSSHSSLTPSRYARDSRRCSRCGRGGGTAFPSNGRASCAPGCYGSRGDLDGWRRQRIGRRACASSGLVRTNDHRRADTRGGGLEGAGAVAKAYDDFMAMFPMTQLALMVRLTFEKLEARGMRPSIAGELLKLIGVTVLATWY